jgi:hypothetical protein
MDPGLRRGDEDERLAAKNPLDLGESLEYTARISGL